MSLRELAGRTAVITGAASGIGRGVAEYAAAAGMRIVAADVERPALDEAVAALREAGGDVVGVPTDVSDPDAVEALAAAAYDAFGAVHLLHNNAGILQAGLTWQRSIADWQWAMNVNFWGVLHGIRAFIPRLLEQERNGDGDIHVLNTSSLGGLASLPTMAPYVVSKFAVCALTECLAHDLRAEGSGIGVSCLVPGFVSSNIGSAARNRPDALAPEPESSDHFDKNEELKATAAVVAIPALDAARMVFEGIQSDEFWITTTDHAHYDAMLRPRYDAILEHRFPGDPR